MTDRRYPSFVNNTTDEDRLANIIISTSLLDEVITLRMVNHFLEIVDTKKNNEDRLTFEREVLSKLSYREKVDALCEVLKKHPERKELKSAFVRIGEIRNSVAHTTDLFGIPRDINEKYKEFDSLMLSLEWFIDETNFEFQSQMNRAYDPSIGGSES